MSHFNPWIDGSIVGVYLLMTMAAGIFVKKYVGKVEDFLVAGREMDVFLGIASLAATEFGIVTCMYEAEMCYKYGFSGAIPGIAQAVAMMAIGLTGFCIKPLRDSGVITIPELLEKRFGPKVRWAAGTVIVLGGLLNMGVFLRVGGEFLVLVCGIGGGDIAAAESNIKWMMTALLVMVAVYTILGGMLSVLVTDFLQFVVMSIGLIVVTILVLYQVGWTELSQTVQSAPTMIDPPKPPPGGTLPAFLPATDPPSGAAGFNPFIHTGLGWPFVIFQLLLNTAATLTWQTTIARVLAARDTATGRKVYTRTSFFFVCRSIMPGIWGIAALWYFTKLGQGLPSNPLHAMPMFLSTFVPVGLMGLLVAAMLAADMSTDSSYMLTWGSVIYNDLMAPWHRGRWSEKRGLLINRFIVALIGVFLLIYGLWFKLEGNLWDYLTLTGAIYLASMSTLLIACCYWKRANDWGAFAAIVVGAVVPFGYLVIKQLDWPSAKAIGPYYSGIAAFVGAWIAMIVGSLLKNAIRPAFPPGSEVSR